MMEMKQNMEYQKYKLWEMDLMQMEKKYHYQIIQKANG